MIVSEQVMDQQVSHLLRAGLAEEIERQEREDTARGPEAARVRTSAVRPADGAARVLLDGWYREHASMMRRVVARSVRREDVDLVEDIAQDVWVGAVA